MSRTSLRIVAAYAWSRARAAWHPRHPGVRSEPPVGEWLLDMIASTPRGLTQRDLESACQSSREVELARGWIQDALRRGWLDEVSDGADTRFVVSARGRRTHGHSVSDEIIVSLPSERD